MHDWFDASGPFITLIWIVAALGVLLVFDRAWATLVRAEYNGRPFIERVIQMTRSGKTDEAIKLCSRSRTILSDIALLILRTRTQEETDLQNVAEAAALSLVPRLNRRLHWFGVLARTSLALGALGLIDGLRVAFELQAGAPGSIWMASATAMRAPEVGLAVSAVLLLVQGFFSGRASQVVEQVDELSARLVNALIDRPDVRLGHR